MTKSNLIGGVIGTSALLTAILCGCCGCDCSKKCNTSNGEKTAQIIIIAPAEEDAMPCHCKMCQKIKQQIKRMKKSEVLSGARHNPKVKRDKAQCAGSPECPVKTNAAAAAKGENDGEVVESFSIVAVEAVPDNAPPQTPPPAPPVPQIKTPASLQAK